MENIEDYEESEPYLEAKQYMDRLKQEHEKLLKENETSQRSNDPTDLTEHNFSLTVFPVTVPCASLSYATVQWDIPETPAEPLTSGCDTGSGNEVDFSVGSELDWTFSLPSTEHIYNPNQEGIVDILLETEQQPEVTLIKEMVSSQVCKVYRMSLVVYGYMGVCISKWCPTFYVMLHVMLRLYIIMLGV